MQLHVSGPVKNKGECLGTYTQINYAGEADGKQFELGKKKKFELDMRVSVIPGVRLFCLFGFFFSPK